MTADTPAPGGQLVQLPARVPWNETAFHGAPPALPETKVEAKINHKTGEQTVTITMSSGFDHGHSGANKIRSSPDHTPWHSGPNDRRMGASAGGPLPSMPMHRQVVAEPAPTMHSGQPLHTMLHLAETAILAAPTLPMYVAAPGATLCDDVISTASVCSDDTEIVPHRVATAPPRGHDVPVPGFLQALPPLHHVVPEPEHHHEACSVSSQASPWQPAVPAPRSQACDAAAPNAMLALEGMRAEPVGFLMVEPQASGSDEGLLNSFQWVPNVHMEEEDEDPRKNSSSKQAPFPWPAAPWPEKR